MPSIDDIPEPETGSMYEEIDPDVDAFAHLFRDLRALTIHEIRLVMPMILDAVGLERVDMFLEAVAEQMDNYAGVQEDFDRLVECIEQEMGARRRAFVVIFGYDETAPTAA